MCQITEQLVNIMLSLFTPTNAFIMEDEEQFQKYVGQNEKNVTMDEMTRNNGEACWRWMTSKEALEKLDRPSPMMDMLPRETADRIDDLLMSALGTDVNYLMVPRSTVWEEIYKGYLGKVKSVIEKAYATVLCEDEKKQRVNRTIWRKIEWVTMRHEGRGEPPFPLLTKSLLPRLGHVLTQVRNSIAEVCG